MRRFRVGDRVTVTTRRYGIDQVGQVGTVHEIITDIRNFDVRVAFDQPQPDGRPVGCWLNSYSYADLAYYVLPALLTPFEADLRQYIDEEMNTLRGGQ